jgi:hypothetical protein
MAKRDHEREIGRRALIKWSLAAGAALGVGRSRICSILERTAGRSVAEAAANQHNKRSIHIRAGTGGLAWFQLMWPHNDIAAALNPAFAWHRPAGQQVIQGTGGMLTVAADTPFQSLPPAKQVTAMMAGINQQHTDNPDSIVRSVNGGSLFAIASVLQADTPSVVPVITIGNLDFGSAPGAPSASNALTSDDVVGLFNSAASRAGGLLATGGHADLYRAQYATLAELNRASGLSTTRDAYHTSRSASKFLGTNLAKELQFRVGTDDVNYGLTGSVFASISNNPQDTGGGKQDQLTNFARGLAVAAKAFEMGLASSVVLPSIRDDPHGAFGGGGNLTSESVAVLATLKTILDAFMADLGGRTDSVTGERLSDGTIITIEGDTPKTPLVNNTWPDDTPQNSNWMFVLGGGSLKTGWFGGIDRNQTVTGFNPATGNPKAPDATLQAQAAVAATAYAITRGDRRRVGDFTNVDITGIVV